MFDRGKKGKGGSSTDHKGWWAVITLKVVAEICLTEGKRAREVPVQITRGGGQ